MIDTTKYLKRINYTQEVVINKDSLFKLQRAHLLNIPFENLDIHYGRPIKLDINYIYHKIIENNRGGFCYELNSLFNQLLIELGFKSKIISARTFEKGQSYSPEYDHLALIVSLDGEDILVDVGFGKFTLEPLPIKFNKIISDQYGDFTFDNYSATHIRISQIKNDKLNPQYIFTKKERALNEFAERCDFHQKSKESHFTQKKVISIAKEKGRVTLNNTQLKITESKKEQVIIFKEVDFEIKLKDYFNIEIK